MSTTDKTGEKLLASMRKTKAAAADKAAAPPKSTQKARTKPAQRPARKRTAAKRDTSATGIRADAYQSGRRVWPD